ncbi:MAG: exodeoxyribonuclease III [Byssovorax sp.]
MSWNVNGLRAVLGKGFSRWIKRAGAEVVGLQEVRAREEQVEAELAKIKGFHRHIVAAERPGYSGVGLFSTVRPDEVETSLGAPHFDVEGRFQLARFGELVIVNAYFPNGKGKERDNSRVPYKLDFYRKVFDRLEPERKKGRPILVMGDFNTAHRPIDLARPRENEKISGFLPEERAELDRWLSAGWIDTFRRFEEGPGHYSWWAQRGGARERNVGWRIDYVLCSEGAEKHLKAAFIWPKVTGSDHCPVGVEVDDAIVKGKKTVLRKAAR